MDKETLECFFCAVLEGQVVWFCASTHPVSWTWDFWQEKEQVVKYIRKAVASLDKAAAIVSAEGQAWAADHEAIMEYMTVDELPGGGSRQTSMLCVFWEHGLFKVALQDRQEGLSLWASAQSIPEALAALEARLRAGDGDWRPMRGQRPVSRKK